MPTQKKIEHHMLIETVKITCPDGLVVECVTKKGMLTVLEKINELITVVNELSQNHEKEGEK